MGIETWRQHYLWQINTIKTISLLALFTEKVRMLVIIVFVVMTMTEFVFRAIATTIDNMYQMMLTKER